MAIVRRASSWSWSGDIPSSTYMYYRATISWSKTHIWVKFYSSSWSKGDIAYAYKGSLL